MYESLIFALILIFLNLILTYKPMPILGLVVGLITFSVGVGYFINDTTLPFNSPNPIFSIFVMLMILPNFYTQYIDIKKPK